MPSSSNPIAAPDDIDDRIHRAHFVKVHFLDGHLMDVRLRLAQTPENLLRALSRTRRKARRVNHPDDFRKPPMSNWAVPMAVIAVLFAGLGVLCGSRL